MLITIDDTTHVTRGSVVVTFDSNDLIASERSYYDWSKALGRALRPAARKAGHRCGKAFLGTMQRNLVLHRNRHLQVYREGRAACLIGGPPLRLAMRASARDYLS